MLTTAEIQTLLDSLTYKPGWRFNVYDGAWEGQHFVIWAELPDAYHPGQAVTVDIHSMLPPMTDPFAFYRWLGWRLARIEVHEMREFLRVAGEPVFDPHAEFAEHDLS